LARKRWLWKDGFERRTRKKGFRVEEPLCIKYGGKNIRPIRVLGPNLTFSNRQFPTLCSWKHIKSILQLENYDLFKPLEVEVQGIKAASIVHDCISLRASNLNFCFGFHTKRYLTTNAFLLKQPFLQPFVIFKSFVTLIILSTGFLVHSQTFVDSHKDCGLGEGGEVGYFWCKMGIGRSFCPSTVYRTLLAAQNGQEPQ